VHQVWDSDLALGHSGPDTREIHIESPVESHLKLDSSLFYFLKGPIYFAQRVIDRFFAKDMLSGPRGLHHQFGMRIGGRTNQHRIDRGITANICAVRSYSSDSIAFRNFFRRIAIYVGDCDRFRFGQPKSQRFGVHLSDAASANDPDSKFFPRQAILLGRYHA
jgi:hypothetical protein